MIFFTVKALQEFFSQIFHFHSPPPPSLKDQLAHPLPGEIILLDYNWVQIP